MVSAEHIPDRASADRLADYVRQARRLRARHGADLGRLHQSLRELAESATREDAPPLRDWSSPATRFAERVAKSLDGPILRYSMRMELLKQAERMGIERFEANLIIAAIQHRMRQRPPHVERSATSDQTGTLLPSILTFAAVQLAIGWAAWRLWFG